MDGKLLIGMALVLGFIISVSGCAAMTNLGQSLDGGSVEQVEGKYHVELKLRFESATKHRFLRKSPAQIMRDMEDNVYLRSQPKYDLNQSLNRKRWRGMVHYYCLDSPRFIRYIRMDTVESIKNIDIYVWEGETWQIVRQLKSPIDAQTRIDINRRTNAISAVHKTISYRKGSRGHITDLAVYVQKK